MFKKTHLFVILLLEILSLSAAVNSSDAPFNSSDEPLFPIFQPNGRPLRPNESFNDLSLPQLLPCVVYTAFLKDFDFSQNDSSNSLSTTTHEDFTCTKKSDLIDKPNNADVATPPVTAQDVSSKIPAELLKKYREEQKIETSWKSNNSSSINSDNTAARAPQQPSSGFSQNNSIGISIPTTEQNSLPRDASAMPKKKQKVQAAACDYCCLQ